MLKKSIQKALLLFTSILAIALCMVNDFNLTGFFIYILGFSIVFLNIHILSKYGDILKDNDD